MRMVWCSGREDSLAQSGSGKADPSLRFLRRAEGKRDDNGRQSRLEARRGGMLVLCALEPRDWVESDRNCAKVALV